MDIFCRSIACKTAIRSLRDPPLDSSQRTANASASAGSSAAPLITKIQKLFCQELAKANDLLRHENKPRVATWDKRVQLVDEDRRTLIRFGLPIKERLREDISIVRPETMLGGNRRMKRRKWTFDNILKRTGRPPGH